jgi:hypothetical protein
MVKQAVAFYFRKKAAHWSVLGSFISSISRHTPKMRSMRRIETHETKRSYEQTPDALSFRRFDTFREKACLALFEG